MKRLVTLWCTVMQQAAQGIDVPCTRDMPRLDVMNDAGGAAHKQKITRNKDLHIQNFRAAGTVHLNQATVLTLCQGGQ